MTLAGTVLGVLSSRRLRLLSIASVGDEMFVRLQDAARRGRGAGGQFRAGQVVRCGAGACTAVFKAPRDCESLVWPAVPIIVIQCLGSPQLPANLPAIRIGKEMEMEPAIPI